MRYKGDVICLLIFALLRTMIPEPQIIDLCILIPCYNDFGGLIRSINSIVYNTEKYLILLVDDGSTECITIERINQNIPEVVNFKIIRLEHNMGITNALNRGLEFIYANFSVQFIARLDCGDICSPDRFYTQISFLQSNPGIHLLGTWCYFKDYESGAAYKFMTPTQHKQITRSMNFRNVFIHPTVMWRYSGVSKLKYPEQYPYAEDYGLFYDMISKIKSAIISEFLITCQINNEGISIGNRTIQLKSRLKVISYYSKNKFLFLLGAIKLKLLMIIPYHIVFILKKNLYRA